MSDIECTICSKALAKCTIKKENAEIKIAKSWLWTFSNVKAANTF